MALFELGFGLKQKLFWLFLRYELYISLKLLHLTTSHNWPVPVDKHGNDTNFTLPPDLLGGVKDQIFKFCDN